MLAERTSEPVREGVGTMSHHVNAARVGRRLRELREARGFSQARLEAIAGVPKARISRYENGHVMPSVPTLDRLAAALGLTLSELFLGLS